MEDTNPGDVQSQVSEQGAEQTEPVEQTLQSGVAAPAAPTAHQVEQEQAPES